MTDILEMDGEIESFSKEFGFLSSSAHKESACSARDPSSISGLGSSPEEGIGNPLHLPGESPQTEEPGGLQSIGLQRVGHN